MAEQTEALWGYAAQQFREWLRQQGKSPFTIKNYLHDLTMFGRWHEQSFGHEPEPEKLQPLDYISYRAYLQTERRQSASTVNRRVAALKCFAGFLHSNDITSRNVGEELGYLAAPPQAAPDILTHAQVLQLFKSIDRTTSLGKRDYAIIQVFVQCGLRLKELADIQTRDLDLKQRSGTLKIPVGKGGNPREIPLNKTAREAIVHYLPIRPRVKGIRHLFLSQKRKPLAPRSIQDVVKKYLRMIGVSKLSCHSLRHLFATNLYNAHKDIVLVKEALGHKRLGTTLRYSHKTQQEKQDALENTPLNVMR